MQRDSFPVPPFPDIQLWDELPEDLSERTRICIATEEIIGPVRNGGIASTYYHLALGLASRGHEVHVLYLKGRKIENETPEHWIEHFANLGVALHYLEMPETPLWGSATVWQCRYAAAYDWLKTQKPFGIVHTSEWRGGLMYALMAKSMGLAFQDTLFVVKTSSPHIWNRHYQMLPIQKTDLIAAGFAEQKCVELADMVVGGSSHLLRFMAHIGYTLPEGRTFCQPNIVDFDEVPVTDLRPPRAWGDIVDSDEVTFFGRLEARKGIELFCSALDILISRGKAPKKVNFLGKYGDALSSRGGQPVPDFLAQRSASWPFEVEVITDKNQPEALSFLSSRDMLVVMPSLIENSTMAVYEALNCKLPFFATAVGGTPELIAEEDHGSALIEPTPGALADRLELALDEGLLIPHPSFTNEQNLQTWFDFHAYVAKIQSEGRHAELPGQSEPEEAEGKVAYILHARDADELLRLAEEFPEDFDEIRIVAGDAELSDILEKVETRLTDRGIDAHAELYIGLAAGEALNRAVEQTSAQHLVVSDDGAVTPKTGFAQKVRCGLTKQPNDLLTTFLIDENQTVYMPMGGDIASQFATGRAFGPEIVAISRPLLDALGPFEPYDMRSGLIHELVTRAVETKGAELLVLAEPHMTWRRGEMVWSERADGGNYAYMKSKALLDGAGLPLRKVLLSGLSGSGSGGGGVDPMRLREKQRPDDVPVWMIAADQQRDNVEAVRNARAVIALDDANSRLFFLVRGLCERQVIVNETPVETKRVATGGTIDVPVTLDIMDVPDNWLAPATYGVKLTLDEPGGTRRTRYVRIIKIAPKVLSIVSGSQILSASAIHRLYDLHNRPETASTLESFPATDFVEDAASESFDLPSADPDVLASLLEMKPEQLSDLLVGASEKANAPTTSTKDAIAAFNSILESGVERPSPTVRAAVTPRSNADFAEPNLRGWAWDRAAPNKTLHVVATVNGTPVAVSAADRFAPELGIRTPGLEQHGFEIDFNPEKLVDGGVLELRIAETGTPLRAGRFRIVAGLLVDAPVEDARPAQSPQLATPTTSSSGDGSVRHPPRPTISKMLIGALPYLSRRTMRLLSGDDDLEERDPRVREAFDAQHYAGQAPDVVAKGQDLLKHYLSEGWRSGLDPSPSFSTREYLRLNDDVASSGKNPFVHYVLYGREEGRATAPSDWKQGEDSETDTAQLALFTLSDRADVRNHGGSAHYPAEMRKLLLGAGERPRYRNAPNRDKVENAFDRDYYVMNYGDVRANPEIDPAGHFALHGAAEGRNPSADFSTKSYLARYGSKGERAVDAYLHWVKTGRQQGEVAEGPKNFVETAALSGIDPAEAAQLVAKRRASIRERLHHGKLGEMVLKATKIDPTIGGTWPESFRVKIPPFASEERNANMIAINALQQELGLKTAEFVICVNRIRWGSGRRIEGHMCHALSANIPSDRIVVLTTEDGGRPPPGRFPDGVRLVDVSASLKTLGQAQRERMLTELLRSLQPTTIVNINSRLLWDAMDTYGNALAERSKLIGCFLCTEQNALGLASGYLTQMPTRHASYLNAIITDSKSLEEELKQRFQISDVGPQIMSLPMPAPQDIPAASLPDNKRPQVFWAGRFDRQKRPQIVIELARSMKDVDFHMWGEAVTDDHLSQEIAKITNLKLYEPYKRITDLPLDNADAWLYTSGWDGVPGQLLEVAMAAVPIVGTLVGGTGEVIDHGLSYPVGVDEGADAYREAIYTVLNDPQAARANAIRLRTILKEERTPETFAAKFKPLWQQPPKTTRRSA